MSLPGRLAVLLIALQSFAVAHGQEPEVRQPSRASQDKAVGNAVATPLGLFLEGPDGIFIAYQSALPPDEEGNDAGFVGYYVEGATRRLYVFSDIIFEDADVTAALIEIGWQFDTQADDFKPRGAVERWHLGVRSVEAQHAIGTWVTATQAEVFAVMGFAREATTASDSPIVQGDGAVAAACPPSETHATGVTLDPVGRHVMPAPPPIPNESLTGALMVLACSGGGGGSGDGDPGCICCDVFQEPGGVASSTPCCQGGCDDGDPCTDNDICDLFEGCIGTRKVCTEPNPCKFAQCVNGSCESTNRPDGAPCAPSDTCTMQGVCMSGNCTNPPKCPGQDCCDGLCCDQCCDPEVASCCNGTCCNGGTCCELGEHCCDSSPTGCCLDGADCCESSASGCCGEDQECCTDDCCDCCDPSNGGACCTTVCCGEGNACCAAGEECCGGTTCCDPDFCCGNGQCCGEECEGCLINGTLDASDADITVSPEVVCVGEAMTFSVGGVVDTGGMERVFCTAKTGIPPGGVAYTWTLTIPPDYPPPLPPLMGSGPSVNVVAKVPGSYSVSFDAEPTRTKCPPPSITVGTVSKTVALSASLSADPTDISAKSTGTPWDFSVITVAWDPANCEGTLEIVTPLIGNNNYTPPNDGMLQRINETTWVYTAFDEPQTELWPEDVTVTIAAMQGSTQVGTVNVRVRPVHTFWTHAHRHGPGMPLHSPNTADLTNDYDFLRWKYAGVLATTGGFFTSAEISTSFLLTCPNGTTGFACTMPRSTPGWDVEFGTSTFQGSENQVASIIGHELVHTSGTWPFATTECTAYTWELNHSQQTGVFQCDPTFLGTIVQNQNCACNGCP